MLLPNNTYYKDGILINGNRHKDIDLKTENKQLKLEITRLKKELENERRANIKYNNNKAS
jgi:hypothetical protein